MLAYDKIVYIELPSDDTLPSPTNKPSEAPAFEVNEGVTTPQAEPQKKPKAPAGLVAKNLEDNADEDGWAHLGALGSNITKLWSDFDLRTHGYKKPSNLIKSYPHAFGIQANLLRVRNSVTTSVINQWGSSSSRIPLPPIRPLSAREMASIKVDFPASLSPTRMFTPGLGFSRKSL